jgi:hypothetical protein
MSVVYLDRQIVIDHAFDKSIIDAVGAFRSRGAIFPYSPAHVEEIAKAHHVGGGAPLEEQIAHLKELSGGLALMPDAEGPAKLQDEDIMACLRRVKDHGGRELTEAVVELERERMQSYKGPRSTEVTLAIRREVQKCRYDNVFSQQNISRRLNQIAVEYGFRIRTASFGEREATLAILFDLLNRFGFKAELSGKRVENRIHDVSHAIYASYADLFVTNDDKLRDSAKAVFNLCQFDVVVLDRAEFIACANA